MNLIEGLTKYTVELINTCKQTILPSFKTPHYVFSTRDISRIFQGFMLAHPMTHDTPDSLIKLWAHECKRCLEDRLSSFEDRRAFQSILQNILKVRFREDLNQENLYMVNFLHSPVDGRSLYELCDNKDKLQTTI